MVQVEKRRTTTGSIRNVKMLTRQRMRCRRGCSPEELGHQSKFTAKEEERRNVHTEGRKEHGWGSN